MLIVTHHLRTSSEFMDRYLPDGPAGGFFLSEKYGMRPGAHICLELVLDWLDEIHFAYATVERTGVEWANCGRVERGAIVRLDPQEAALRRDLVARVRASAESVRLRGADRLAADLHVHYFGERSAPRNGRALDISPTGVFIRARRPLPRGAEIHLRLEDRAGGALRHVRGRVVRLDFTGTVAGMGIEFQFANRSERRTLRRFCRHLAAPAPPIDRPATTC